MGHQKQVYIGRAFRLADGTIILPCEFCGNPVWWEHLPTHTCPGLLEAIEQEMEDAESA